MSVLDQILESARQSRRHIILPEGEDPRIREAARRAVAEGLARITLLGDPARIEPISGVEIIDPARYADLDRLAGAYFELRKHKGMTPEAARSEMARALPQAAMRVRLGLADGSVAGAVATTADTVRAALQIIGRAPGVRVVSSFFLMLGTEQSSFKGGMIFSDCGLVIDPDAAELASIARSAAQSCRDLLGETPRVALLSFSTAGSAEHESLQKIREAVALVRAEEPGLEIDGEMQFDAAFEDAIRHKKAPQSPLTGRPNVFVFPNLAAGNIGYKIAQRLGGLDAIGPVLQGLALPANDLSRGCSVDDVIAAIAVTAAQARVRAPA